jgi:2-oxo-4-hydroxy-4-carboxy-5-ureidoimidazoline decarboxylase
MMINVRYLNRCDGRDFVRVCGPLFEHSPWIAERTLARRPFGTRAELHEQLCRTMYDATADEQVNLIASHPDLVGRLAREGELTRESTGEQAAAGLAEVTGEEIAAFDRYNSAYRGKFGFPFVICARENRKDEILAAFPVRLQNTREHEIIAALAEIAKIAWLRLLDRVMEE